jgi:hypothetical protein
VLQRTLKQWSRSCSPNHLDDLIVAERASWHFLQRYPRGYGRYHAVQLDTDQRHPANRVVIECFHRRHHGHPHCCYRRHSAHLQGHRFQQSRTHSIGQLHADSFPSRIGHLLNRSPQRPSWHCLQRYPRGYGRKHAVQLDIDQRHPTNRVVIECFHRRHHGHSHCCYRRHSAHLQDHRFQQSRTHSIGQLHADSFPSRVGHLLNRSPQRPSWHCLQRYPRGYWRNHAVQLDANQRHFSNRVVIECFHRRHHGHSHCCRRQHSAHL